MPASLVPVAIIVRRTVARAFLPLVTVAASAIAQPPAVDVARHRLVDLTHALNARTLYWPTATTGFQLQQLAFGDTPGGYFYSSFAFAAPEHGGTHVDAPIHFHRGGLSADQLPLEQLIGPAVVIDVRAKAAADADYRLTMDDVAAWEKAHGRIPRGAFVLLRTGWGLRWPDAKAYFGDDTRGDASKLHFPSFGVEAARVLVQQRRVAALGADVASIDYGPSTDFMVHRVAAAAGVIGLENLARLETLPARGATIIALPMKIEGGSGGPVRVLALVPRRAAR
jgi:kynurenine formamidase